jgi:hypothetical protein
MRLFKRSDGRYYAICPPVRDLLGDEVIVTFHGNVRSRQGGVYCYPAAAMSVEQLVKIRQQHGYVESYATSG